MWSDFGFGDGALSSPGLSGLGDSPEGATPAVLAAPSHWPRAGGGGGLTNEIGAQKAMGWNVNACCIMFNIYT